MNATTRRALVVVSAWCVLALAAPPAQADPPDPRVAKIVEAWAKRQTKFDSVRYVVSGQTTYVKGTATDEQSRPLTPPKPSRDFVGKVEWKVLLDFATHRDRWEVDEEGFLYNEEKLERVLRLNVCDGKVAQNSRPRLPGTENDDAPANYANLDMSIVRGNLSTILFEAGSLPLFHGHGIVPTTEDRVYAGHLRRSISPESFYIHGTGVHEGRPCLVLRTEAIRTSAQSFHEFWVDEAREAAIVRYAYYTNGNVDENYDVRYQDTPDGWMPASWTFTVFLRQKTHTIKQLRVLSREVSPPLKDQDFRLEVLPWMRVRQVQFGESPNPLVSPPIQGDTMQVAGAGFGGLGAAEKSGWSRLVPWFGAALAAAAAVAGLLLYRARKARPGGRSWTGRVSG
jgi:hypothetical protein